MSLRDVRRLPTALCAAAAGAPAWTQTLGGAQSSDVSIWRVVFAFVACVAVAVVAAFLLRARMTGRLDLPKFVFVASRRLILVERLRLGTQHDLCLVTIDGEEYLIGLSPTGIQRYQLPDQSSVRDTP